MDIVDCQDSDELLNHPIGGESYGMETTIYDAIWDGLEERRSTRIDYTVIDRYLRFWYKLEATSDEANFITDEYKVFPFLSHDAKLLTLFRLRYE